MDSKASDPRSVADAGDSVIGAESDHEKVIIGDGADRLTATRLGNSGGKK